MKRTMFLLVLTFSAAGAFAFSWGAFERNPSYLSQELRALETEYGARSLADLKIGDLVPVAGRLDVARQKDSAVVMAGGLSLASPGLGQFASGDWSKGLVHTGLHVGVTAATLAWAHSVLPADLRWGTLDYLGSRENEIEAAWGSHRPREYLPAAGALAVGGLVDLALRFWSARDAQATMRTRIDDGSVTFEPRFDGRHWGMGMAF